MYLGSSPRRRAFRYRFSVVTEGTKSAKRACPGTEKAPNKAHCERAGDDIADKPVGGLAVIQHEKVQHAAGDDNPME